MTEPSTPATGPTRAPDSPADGQPDTEASGTPTGPQAGAPRREPASLRCNHAHLRQPHAGHDWEPQPGMAPVHCPGFDAALSSGGAPKAASNEPQTGAERRQYPYADGDVLVIGPECFASSDLRVISFRGAIYDRENERHECQQCDNTGACAGGPCAHPAAQRRERYAKRIASVTFGRADDDAVVCAADAAMAVADEEQRELRDENARLRAELEHWRPDGGDGYGTPVHWTVYNAMHRRALKAEKDRDWVHNRAETARSAWSKTHSRALAAEQQRDRARATAVELENQLAAVADLHHPVSAEDHEPVAEGDSAVCAECPEPWPCPTAQALDADGGAP